MVSNTEPGDLSNSGGFSGSSESHHDGNEVDIALLELVDVKLFHHLQESFTRYLVSLIHNKNIYDLVVGLVVDWPIQDSDLCYVFLDVFF